MRRVRQSDVRHLSRMLRGRNSLSAEVQMPKMWVRLTMATPRTAYVAIGSVAAAALQKTVSPVLVAEDNLLVGPSRIDASRHAAARARFPRVSEHGLSLSRLDELILQQLSPEWQTPARVFVNAMSAGSELGAWVSHTGDQYVRAIRGCSRGPFDGTPAERRSSAGSPTCCRRRPSPSEALWPMIPAVPGCVA